MGQVPAGTVQPAQMQAMQQNPFATLMHQMQAVQMPQPSPAPAPAPAPPPLRPWAPPQMAQPMDMPDLPNLPPVDDMTALIKLLQQQTMDRIAGVRPPRQPGDGERKPSEPQNISPAEQKRLQDKFAAAEERRRRTDELTGRVTDGGGL